MQTASTDDERRTRRPRAKDLRSSPSGLFRARSCAARSSSSEIPPNAAESLSPTLSESEITPRSTQLTI